MVYIVPNCANIIIIIIFISLVITDNCNVYHLDEKRFFENFSEFD